MELITGILTILYCVDIAFASGCVFPPDWQGLWYTSGRGEIRIGVTNITHTGECSERDGYKFRLYNRVKKCHTCMVFTNQTTNLIQYKESFCLRGVDFKRLCERITGEFTLHSLIRVPSVPVPCPFQGSYMFSYTNGSGHCTKPYSQMHECADNSRYKFRFKQCPGIPRTSDLELDFQCLATWNNGDKMLYGKFTGKSLGPNENMYRCMIHEFWGSEGDLSMSVDASCQGPQSAHVGPFTMDLKRNTEANKAYREQPPCRFPEYFANVHKWKDLTGRYIVEVEDNMNVFRIKDNIHGLNKVPKDNSHGPIAFPYEVRTPEIRLVARCVSFKNAKQSDNDFLTYTTNDTCESTYQCVRIKKITKTFFRMDVGTPNQNAKDACQRGPFVGATSFFLIPANTSPSPCPMPGTYAYKDYTTNCVGSLIVGCHNENEVEIQASCPSMHKTVEIVQCLYYWKELHMVHLITQKPTTGTRTTGYCLTFADSMDIMNVYSNPFCSSDLLLMMNKTLSIQLTKPKAKCVRQKGPVASSGKQHQKGDHIIAVPNGGSNELINGADSNWTRVLWHQMLLSIVTFAVAVCLQSSR